MLSIEQVREALGDKAPASDEEVAELRDVVGSLVDAMLESLGAGRGDLESLQTPMEEAS